MKIALDHISGSVMLRIFLWGARSGSRVTLPQKTALLLAREQRLHAPSQLLPACGCTRGERFQEGHVDLATPYVAYPPR